jgi:uncharacterized protein (DUF58 family)
MANRLKFSRGFSLNRLDLAIKSLSNTSYLGNYKSAFKGAGLEFEEYRTYIPSNDDASRIDWKASKRVGQMVVKEFKEERDVNVYFLVDSSSSMLTGSTKSLKAEYVAEMISTMAQSIIFAGDSVGMAMFAEGIKKEVRKGLGMTKFYAITDELSKVSNYGGYGDVERMLEYAFNTYEEGSLVLVFSDFVNGIESDKFLKLAAKKFDLMLVMIRDPRDLSLPEGEGEIFLEDPSSGTTLLVRPGKIRKDFAKEVSLEISRFRNNVKKYGAEFLLLQTDKPYVKELVKFFNMREQKWR